MVHVKVEKKGFNIRIYWDGGEPNRTIQIDFEGLIESDVHDEEILNFSFIDIRLLFDPETDEFEADIYPESEGLIKALEPFIYEGKEYSFQELAKQIRRETVNAKKKQQAAKVKESWGGPHLLDSKTAAS